MSEQIADGTVKTPSVEDLQAQLKKAEAKIVELKKTSTAEEIKEEPKKEKESDTTVKEEGEDVNKLIEQAVAAALIANNNLTSNNMSMAGTPTPADTFALKTVSEYNSLSANEQRSFMNECIKKNGEFTFATEED